MATTEIIGAKTYTADQRTVDVLVEHAPEAAEALSMTTGTTPGGKPSAVGFHLPEHAVFVSESLAALAELVADQQRRIGELEAALEALQGAS